MKLKDALICLKCHEVYRPKGATYSTTACLKCDAPNLYQSSLPTFIDLGRMQWFREYLEGKERSAAAASVVNIIEKIEEESEMEGKYCMVRTESAGVFAGTLVSRDGKEVLLKDARRMWYWAGAASLSQLAMEGTTAPKKCKFPREVDEVLLTEAIEIIPITDRARQSIAEVPVWES